MTLTQAVIAGCLASLAVAHSTLGESGIAVGVLSLLSAGLIFVMLRGHLAWPIFLLAGAVSLRKAGVLDETWLQAGAAITVGVLLIAAAIHVYWALGGRWNLERVLPPGSEDGFTPGPAITLAVAMALTVFAGLVGLVAFGADSAAIQALVIGGIAVLVARAIGDRRVAGFTKTVRDTDFAIADDRYFTPLCVLLAHGATGAVLV